MKKHKKVFRQFLLVIPSSEGWRWHADAKAGGPFKRLEDAKADAAKALGLIGWRPTGSKAVRGEYGPELTPEQYLKREKL